MEQIKELGLSSEKELTALVAILEAHGEVLTSIYHAQGGYCGLYEKITDVKDTVQRLFDKHVYFENETEMIKRFTDEAKTSGAKNWQEVMSCEEVRIVSNGLVWFQYC